MKRLVQYLTTLSLLVLLTGMGSMGGGPEGGVPQTEENIKVRLTDRKGVALELTKFSLEGKTAIEGQLGSGLMTVFFRNIERADFAASEGENVTVKLRLKGGESLELKLRNRRIFYGATSYGAFQVRARDVASIELL